MKKIIYKDKYWEEYIEEEDINEESRRMKKLNKMIKEMNK